MLYRFMLCFEFYMLLQDLIDTSIICAAFHSLVTVTGHRYSGIRAKANSGLLRRYASPKAFPRQRSCLGRALGRFMLSYCLATPHQISIYLTEYSEEPDVWLFEITPSYRLNTLVGDARYTPPPPASAPTFPVICPPNMLKVPPDIKIAPPV